MGREGARWQTSKNVSGVEYVRPDATYTHSPASCIHGATCILLGNNGKQLSCETLLLPGKPSRELIDLQDVHFGVSPSDSR